MAFILVDPDETIECSRCHTKYEWHYEQLGYFSNGIHPIKAKAVTYARILAEHYNAEDGDISNLDTLYYCSKCGLILAISYTENFELGHSFNYVNVPE